MTPLGKNVLLKWDLAEESRIIIPGPGPERPCTGVIVDVGEEVTNLTQGDAVMFTDSFSSKAIPGHTDLIVMNIDCIILKL